MNLFSQNRPRATSEQIQQIKSWVYRILEVDPEIPLSISQLTCKEPGCPPIETVIAVLTDPVQQYKIHKSINEIDEADICQLI